MRILNVPAPPRTDDPDNAPKVAVLFSGGLDCTVLARLCHDLLPSDQSLDLINVAFENPRVAANAKKAQDQESFKSFDIYETCPDRQTGRKSFAELQSVCSGRVWRFIAVCTLILPSPKASHVSRFGRSMFHTLSTSIVRARLHHSYILTTPRWIYPSPAHCTLLPGDKVQLSMAPPHIPPHPTQPLQECCSQV